MRRLYTITFSLLFSLFAFALAAQDCSQDTIPPIPLPINGLVTTLELGTTQTIAAAALEGGSYDNCTENLTFRIQVISNTQGTPVQDSVVVTEELDATTIVRFWVGDEAGNWAFCDTYILIFLCADGQNTTFNGRRSLTVQLEDADDAVMISGYDFLIEQPEECGPFDALTIARGSIPYDQVASADFTPTLSFSAEDIGTHLVSISGYAPNSFYVHHAYVIVQDENGNGGECESDETPPLIDKTFRGHQVRVSGETDPVVINATELFYFAGDNCTADENLQYRVTRLGDATGEVPPFDTLQLPYDPNGPEFLTLPLELWVGDEAGNWDRHENYIGVQYRVAQEQLSFGGRAFFDLDANCERSAGEIGWVGLTVQGYLLQGGAPVGDGEPFLSAASALGDYEFNFDFTEDELTSINGQPVFLEDTTDLQLLINIPSSLNTGCTSSYLVDVNDHWPLGLSDLDFAMQLEEGCGSPYVDIAAPFLRRCISESTYSVTYANYGTELVEDSFIEIEFDEDLAVMSASIPWTTVVDNAYTFPIGTLEPGAFGSFTVNVLVSCETVLGETHCTEARIYPETLCDEDSYTGPSVEVTASCDEEEEEVVFRIENVGQQDMPLASTYIVVEDVIMLETGEFTLNSGQSTVISVPANGSTYRIEADQVSGHPGFSFPSAAIEGCGTNEMGAFSLGFINLFPQDEFNPNVAIDCQSNIGAFDPNDKTGYPLGVGEEHLIRPNVDLDYRIRFQNTGTDTAFTVVIQDTLSPFLNPASIQTGAASHDYTFQLMDGNVLEFRFANILLPDSMTNLAASQGFVQFSVKQIADNPPGTLIENEASIYFDLNEPIVTNTTQHRIEEVVIVVDVENGIAGMENIQAFPNPTADLANFRLPVFTQGVLRLSHANGQLVRKQTFVGTEFSVDLKGLPPGQYYFQIQGITGEFYAGRIILVP